MKRIILFFLILILIFFIANSGSAINYKGGLETNESLVLPEQSSTPAVPVATKHKFYIKDDGVTYTLNSSGIEKPFNTGSKNLIINGNFNIWQRGISFVTAVNATFSADRFEWLLSGAGAVDITRDTATPPNDVLSVHSIKIDVTTADASLAAGDRYSIRQKIEGFDLIGTGLGTADAKDLTLSFWVNATKSGTHSVAFRNGAFNRSYIAEYNIAVVGTWEFKTITLTADVGGTWTFDKSLGMVVQWPLAVGSTLSTSTIGSWIAGDFSASSNDVNDMDNAVNNFRLAQIKLEIGSAATPFEQKPISQVLALCQRYYEKSYNQNGFPGDVTATGAEVTGLGGASIEARHSFTFKVSKRDSPTLAYYDLNGTISQVTVDASTHEAPAAGSPVGGTGERGASGDFDVTTSGAKARWHWTADAEL